MSYKNKAKLTWHLEQEKHLVNIGEKKIEPCVYCMKSFKTTRSRDTHNNSESHKKRVARIEQTNSISTNEKLVCLTQDIINAIPIVTEQCETIKTLSQQIENIKNSGEQSINKRQNLLNYHTPKITVTNFDIEAKLIEPSITIEKHENKVNEIINYYENQIDLYEKQNQEYYNNTVESMNKFHTEYNTIINNLELELSNNSSNNNSNNSCLSCDFNIAEICIESRKLEEAKLIESFSEDVSNSIDNSINNDNNNDIQIDFTEFEDLFKEIKRSSNGGSNKRNVSFSSEISSAENNFDVFKSTASSSTNSVISSNSSTVHCETCNCSNLAATQIVKLDKTNLIKPLSVDIIPTIIDVIPNNKVVNFISVENNSDTVLLHCDNQVVKIPKKKFPVLKWYKYIEPKNENINNNDNTTPYTYSSIKYIDASTPAKMLTIAEYKTNYFNNQDYKGDLFAFPKIGDNFNFIRKFKNDNGITYNYQYRQLYFDIEAASLDGKFAKAENPTAFITMIQICLVEVDQSVKYILYILDRYVNSDRLNKTLVNESLSDGSGVEYRTFQTSQLMCASFLLYLQNIDKLTLVISFHGVSSRVQALTKKQEKIMKKTKYTHAINEAKKNMPGYDLKFIIQQSTQQDLITPQYHCKQVSGSFYTILHRVEEFNHIIFIDAMPELDSYLQNTPKLKNSVGNG